MKLECELFRQGRVKSGDSKRPLIHAFTFDKEEVHGVPCANIEHLFKALNLLVESDILSLTQICLPSLGLENRRT